MDLVNKVKEFNKRFNIQSDSNARAEFIKFKNRIDNTMEYLINDTANIELIKLNLKYSNVLGVKADHQSTHISSNLKLSFLKEMDEIIYYQKINAIIIALQENRHTSNLSFFLISLGEALQLSTVNLRVKYDKENDYYMLLPQGQRELDSVLVDQPYSFLDTQSRLHFLEAIKYYQKNSLQDRVKSAEQLRRTLEEFLKFKLNNTKGLDANIKDLQKKLKNDGRDPQVRKTISTIMNYLDQYFNENSKHADGDINESECEFLIYQTGVFLRYVDKSI